MFALFFRLLTQRCDANASCDHKRPTNSQARQRKSHASHHRGGGGGVSIYKSDSEEVPSTLNFLCGQSFKINKKTPK